METLDNMEEPNSFLYILWYKIKNACNDLSYSILASVTKVNM